MPGYLTFEKEKREREKKARRRISVFPAFSPRRLIFRISGHRESIDASLSRINYVLLNHALSSSDPDKCVKPKIMRMMLRDSIFFFFLPPPQCTGCAILICFSRKSCPTPPRSSKWRNKNVRPRVERFTVDGFLSQIELLSNYYHYLFILREYYLFRVTLCTAERNSRKCTFRSMISPPSRVSRFLEKTKW